MDGGKRYGLCATCNGTMSVHINVSRPADHKFTKRQVAQPRFDERRESWQGKPKQGRLEDFANDQARLAAWYLSTNGELPEEFTEEA